MVKLLGQHNIPLVINGHKQTIQLRDLSSSIVADQPYEIEVITLNRAGQRSKPAVLRSVILQSGSIEKPTVSFAPPHSSAGTDLCVIPILDKYDEVRKSGR
jgi:hypothetical protein